jgi:hypothetical protein
MTVEQTAAFRIRFDQMVPAQANRAATELRTLIENSGGRDVDVQIVKDRDDTQDFGATLAIVLGTEAVIILAKAIHAYVAKRGDRVVIETGAGRVVATGAGAKNIDISETVAAMRSEFDER